MKFRFPFETLRKVRKIEEDEAQRIFFEAQARLNECLAKIQQMYTSIDEARLTISRLQFSQEQNKLSSIRTNEEFIKGQEVRIKLERQKARELMREVEIKQEALIGKAKDRKVIDRLKEKRFEVFKKEIKVQEQKETDEMVTLRAAKRKVI